MVLTMYVPRSVKVRMFEMRGDAPDRGRTL